MRNIFDEILKYISEDIRSVLCNVRSDIWKAAEEIRIFSERHIIIYTNSYCKYIDKSGNAVDNCNNLYVPPHKSLEKTISLMCNNSIYSELDSIKNGFITLPCGHRVGIVGTTVVESGKVSYIKNVSCINIRIMREVKGFSQQIIPNIFNGNTILNTLIISPPQCGKTTLIRDIARVLGNSSNCRKVGIVDERNEIASMINGKIMSDIGVHSFVINNCPKAEGINMLIRTMSPQVIITDEIGSDADFKAMKKALTSGVKLITTIHSDDKKVFLKSEYGDKVKELFDVFVFLSRAR